MNGTLDRILTLALGAANDPAFIARLASGHLVSDIHCGACAESARENGGNPDLVAQPCEHQRAVMAEVGG